MELYCELLIARIGLLEAKECDPGLEEAIKSIIYAAPRTEVKELQQCRQLLVEKFGKDFALAAVENSDGKVSERVVKKLRVQPPSQELVTLYLKEIANTYEIDWPKTTENPADALDEDNHEGDGSPRKEVLEETPILQDASSQALHPERPASQLTTGDPVADSENPRMPFPKPPKPKGPTTYGDPTTPQERLGPSSPGAPTPPGPKMDDLAARFAALKKGL